MARLVAWARSEWRTVLLVTIGASLQLFLVTRPVEFLITNVLPDDAFYYFEIARNIAAGLGSTFDSVTPTNGYHPLWLVILVPIFAYFSVDGVADVAPIHAALVFSVAINAVTALLVARILARFTENAYIRALGLVIWILNPFILYETINGLETSLSLFLFALFFLLALRVEERKSSNYLILGGVAGLMILARLDLAIYFAAFLAWVLLRCGWRDGFRRVLIAGVVATFVVSPWVAWNIAKFGTPLTSSSVAATVINHQLIVQDHGESWFQTAKAVIYHTQYELDKLFERTGMYAIACGVFGAALALALLGFLKLPSRVALLTVTQSLFVGFMALFFANAGIRWTARTWYFVSFNLFLAILSVYVVDVLFARVSHEGWKRGGVVALALIVAFSFGVDWSKNQRRGSQPQHRQMYEATLWMNEHLPAGTTVGVWNAGIQGYFSQHMVVNLDGTVNNAALSAIRERKLWSYVKDSGIDYLSDFPLYIRYRYKSFLDADDVWSNLELVRRMDESPESLSIWRVK
ncbi:hypothetical protein A3A39_03090 [Candidatus Kaiserbacteria bacterium RIFCSPLOWO2_01_FULL_54_13]|uniref:Glycosyltransferase RgtA/B/C/D-like domain-containing protein n=1 Tax=Candidatus Kaiserbacteria bacterium RIFCSPLOWO2_01_FULL_54_13 TaxID=1798512 RepID=A0A1F6F2I4_9BACT|nr:MAG: hypothetical protein A3A39_03090 [Candidatus Kaiserbacteria bacterium RIFCSPLOWO2_01_FULL_54_13]